MAISISFTMLFALVVLGLHKFGGLKLWHGIVCTLLGLYVGTTAIGAIVRDVVGDIVQAIAHHG